MCFENKCQMLELKYILYKLMLNLERENIQDFLTLRSTTVLAPNNFLPIFEAWNEW